MFGDSNNADTRSFFTDHSAQTQESLKRRRRSETPPCVENHQQIVVASASSITKRPKRDLQPTIQLSFTSPQHSQDPYGTYQPTPPIVDSDSDSSTDRFAAQFGDEDVVMDGQHEQSKAMPRMATGPPTAVMERLDVGGDVDMDQQTTKRKVNSFRMGWKGDCEKCRLRVPGHYSHY